LRNQLGVNGAISRPAREKSIDRSTRPSRDDRFLYRRRRSITHKELPVRIRPFRDAARLKDRYIRDNGFSYDGVYSFHASRIVSEGKYSLMCLSKSHSRMASSISASISIFSLNVRRNGEGEGFYGDNSLIISAKYFRRIRLTDPTSSTLVAASDHSFRGVTLIQII